MQKSITQSSLYYSDAGRPHLNNFQRYLKDPSPSAAEVFTGLSFIFKVVNCQERNSFTSFGRTNTKSQKDPVLSRKSHKKSLIEPKLNLHILVRIGQSITKILTSNSCHKREFCQGPLTCKSPTLGVPRAGLMAPWHE